MLNHVGLTQFIKFEESLELRKAYRRRELKGLDHTFNVSASDAATTSKKLSELGVKEEDIPDLVNKVTRNGTRTVYHHSKPINDEVAKEIYYSCL